MQESPQTSGGTVDERIARLKTAQDARKLAENARRLGRPELAAQALQRAGELKAVEEGYTTPAQQAIAAALYAYEEQQTRVKGRTFRANHTRKMLIEHGALAAAERMVLERRPSKGFEVLEEAGLRTLSFEAIIDRFRDEFSPAAVEAARARLEGRPPPPVARPTAPPPALLAGEADPADDAVLAPAVFDAEALMFLEGFRDPGAWFLANWLPRYRETTLAVARGLANERPQDLFDPLWKSADNGISHAGPGLLKFDTVDGMRDEFVEVIRDIHEDGSPAGFERIVERFEGWKATGRIGMVPRVLIARAYAGVHPSRYHTTVDAGSQNQALEWFAEHTGFVIPRSTSWAVRAQALVQHLERAALFGGDDLTRNIFPWFVVEQLRARTLPQSISPGHTPRPTTAFADLPPERRVIALRHNALLTVLAAQLVKEFGAQNVQTECATGTGGYADAVAWDPDGRCQLYELKIADTAADVVRQAMGQLLEYGFRTGGLEPVKLWAVGEPVLDEGTRRFLARLRTDFHLDIDYRRIGPSDDSANAP